MLVRCKTCLMPTTRPSTAFVDGECSACINFRKRQEIDWGARERKFLSIIGSIPRNGSGYDVIVPSSGGKDSTFQVLKMLELGLRPLVVTARTCHLTEVGRKNIDNLSRYATTVEYALQSTVRAKLNKIGLQLVGDISLPEHMAIFSVPYRAAVDFGVNTIIYGESPLMEYGGPLGSEEARTMGRRYIFEHQGFLGMRPVDFVGMDGITAADMLDYTLPPDDKMMDVTAYFLGQFYPWNSRSNAEVAVAAGMTVPAGTTVAHQWPSAANWWCFENLDNAQTGIHDYFGYLKYGYGRLCAQISVDIRNGVCSREQAYQRVRDYDGNFPIKYAGIDHAEIIKRIFVTPEEFASACLSFTNKELFSGIGAYGKPILKEFSGG